MCNTHYAPPFIIEGYVVGVVSQEVIVLTDQQIERVLRIIEILRGHMAECRHCHDAFYRSELLRGKRAQYCSYTCYSEATERVRL